MKLRNGFVSNSSSSSFIIAFKDKADVCAHCGRGDAPIKQIKDMIENSENDDNKWSADGYDAVVSKIHEWYGKDERTKELVEKINQHAENGYNVAMFSVSYHNETIEPLINNNKSIVIIDKGD